MQKTRQRVSASAEVFIFIASLALSYAPFAGADQQDTQTGTSGTDAADLIEVVDPLTVSATVNASQGQKLEATSTGVDAKAGGDSITGNAAINVDATATAVITTDPKDTEAKATGTGIAAGDGDDTVLANESLTSTATALAAYGNALSVEHDSSSSTKKISVSMSSNVTSAGIDGGAGADTIINSNLVSAFSTATSGGSADQLSATIEDSVSLESVAKAESTSVGVNAGEGADQVTNTGAIAATATALSGALAVGMVAAQAPDPGAPPLTPSKKTQINLDASATASATATGVETESDRQEDSSEETSPFGVNGLSINYAKTLTTVAGDDSLINTALISSIASAVSGAGAGAISSEVNGTVAAIANSEATSTATGLSTGGGNDVITNVGLLDAIATAIANAVSISLEVGAPSPPGGGEDDARPDKDNKSSSTTSVTAKATAVGVDAEGAGHVTAVSRSTRISDGALSIETSTTVDALAGNDAVNNQAAIVVVATARSATTAAAVVVGSGGSTESDSSSSAAASSVGVHTGGGNDTITNASGLTSTATADASAVTISLGVGQGAETPPAEGTPPPVARQTIGSTSKNKAEAVASAIGIDAEGDRHNTTSTRTVSIGRAGLTVVVTEDAESTIGNDSVRNQGVLTASATATSDSTDAAVDIDAVGSLEAQAGANAKAASKGIATGGGNDTVNNSGWIAADALADASALTVAMIVQQTAEESAPPAGEKPEKSNVKVNATVDAAASAIGVDAEGTDHTTTRSTTVDISGNGLSVLHASTSAAAAGDDTVMNTGVVDADAIAASSARSAGLSLGAQGSVSAEADSKADASAVAVYTGGGADAVTNSGALSASASADASAIALALSVTQPEPSDTTADDPSYLDKLKDKFASADSKASAVANANAIGVDAEGGAHTTATTLDLMIDGDGIRATRTLMETSQAGADTIDNSGLTTVTSIATSGALAADIQVQTEGTASSEANATAQARSTGFKTGGGDDLIRSSGGVLANATSGAGALSFSFVQQDGPGAASKSEAKATSDARAVGIEADGTLALVNSTIVVEIDSAGIGATIDRTATASRGADTVDNSGAITANAIAGSAAGGGAISIDGAASADVQSTATAGAAGITTGGGADAITNAGLLTSTATSGAAALAVGYGQKTSESHNNKLKVAIDAKATAMATSDGIVADGGIADDTIDGHLIIDASGLDLAYERNEFAFADADVVDNTGAIGAIATSLTQAAGVAIAIDGAASADVTSKSTARAGGIDGGGGNDVIRNSGVVASVATAGSHALSVGFGQKTAEKTKAKVNVEASATAEASAHGIRGDSGADRTTELRVLVTGAGLDTHYLRTEVAATGNDSITNTGGLTATSFANADAQGAAIAIDGVAKADIEATARADASAIESGGGNDTVTNSGILVARADATADAMAAGVGAKSSDTGSARTKVNAETKSEATATGIGADTGVRDTSLAVDLTIDDGGLDFAFARSSTGLAGDDEVINTGNVTSAASATSGTQSVALSIKGAARADADSSSTATAYGIDAGGGADDVFNSGVLNASADASATTLSASISTEGSAIANSGLVKGGTEAESKAVGLSSSGARHEESLQITTTIDFDSIGVSAGYLSIMDGLQDGNDFVDNTGDITATSAAIAAQLEAGITGKGAAVSLGRSQADAYAGAIDAGHGDDIVLNEGDLTADAFSTAAMGNVAVTGKGLAVAANAVWDGGTTAKANAVGINADSGEKKTKTVDVEANAQRAQVIYQELTEAAAGDDVIDNRGAVSANAMAIAPSLTVAVAAKGVAAAVSTSTAEATATALRGGHGDDLIDNSGVLTSTADATAATANVSVTNAGVAAAADAVWNGGTTSHATAIGIAGDGGALIKSTRIAIGTDEMSFEKDEVVALADGADVIDNTAAVTADATARAFSAGVAVAVSGVGVATASANANARASAIDAGAGEAIDDVTNSGHLTANATAVAAAASVSITNAGLALSSDSVWDGGTRADARARGIDVGVGGETIVNSGAMNVSADSTTLSAAVSVAVSGVAGASATSTGTADAVAIDASAGADGDTIVNDGEINVDASALAASAAVAVTNAGLAIAADAVWDGGTGANARARGIDVGDGMDDVTNRAAIDANASSIAASLGVSVAVAGVAGATATSTSTADAAAIDLGNGADVLVNEALLTTTADATAATATVSVTSAGAAVSADAVWDGGTTADAKARGVAVGSGADQLSNSGDMVTTANARALSAAVSVALTGAAGAISTSTAKSDARAIEAEADDDDVFNSGDLDAIAYSNAASAAVSFTAAGVAAGGGNVWDGGTRGEAKARAIDLGSGADDLVNRGSLSADAEAHATGISVSVAVEGVAGAITAATAVADAAAIDGGDGADGITNSGDLVATSHANANTISAAGTKFGVSVAGNNAWDGGTRGEAASAGIRGGAGADTIDNGGAIRSESTVVAPSVAIGFTVGGVSAAISTATADAEAKAIDGGDAADVIDNTGALDVIADANAVAVNVSIAGVGAAVAADAVWDGGTTAEARARGIDGGVGDDVISNTSTAAAINTTANATAVSSSTSITAGGFAGSTSTSTAIADSRAIDAGSGNDLMQNQATLTSVADAQAVSVSVAVAGAGGALASDSFWDGGTKASAFAAGMSSGEGNDQALNTGAIDVDASSSTTSVAVAITGGGLAGAAVASTSTADAVGMTGDSGNDLAINQGSIASDAVAEAHGVSVAFTPVGGAGAGALVDAATRAYGTAKGMTGDAGDDTVINDQLATIDVGATARTRETAVAVTLQGIAVAEANAIATGRAVGIDGGDGADLVRNDGSLAARVDADSIARAIAFTQLGGGIATANATADAAAVGLGGGDGDDRVQNFGSIALVSNARAKGQAIGIAVTGAAIAAANADGITDGVGMHGGAGIDTMRNSGSIDVATAATTTARSISAASLGVALGTANSTAVASASGMRGGEGNDVIVNTETASIDVATVADTIASTVSIAVAGAADGEARTRPIVTAAGIAGDGGDDTLVNDGSIDVTGRAKSVASGTSVTVAGSASARAGTEVDANLVGVSGGSGADIVVNRGSIVVGPPAGDAWMATLDVNASSFGFAGGAKSDTEATARTTSTGIDGGADADQLVNEGSIDVVASALNRSSASSMSIFGSGVAGGQSGAFTHGIGMSGGAAQDLIDNMGSIDVLARSRLELSSASYSFAGSGASGGTLAALTEADGMLGDDDDDQLFNAGQVIVDARSELTSSGRSEATFGGSSGTTRSGGATRASGLDGGAGDDLIANEFGGLIDVDAETNVTTAAMAYTFGGGSGNDAVLTGETDAAGIIGGSGADSIVNRGSVDVDARATLNASGGAESSIGGSKSTGTSVARAAAAGIDGGDHADLIESYGAVRVRSQSIAQAHNSANAVVFAGKAETGAVTRATSEAVGLAGGAGANEVMNAGDLDVVALSTGYAFSYATGAGFSFNGDGLSRAQSNADAYAYGIKAGNDGNTIISTGDIEVLARATTAKDVVTTVGFYTPPTDADGSVVNRSAIETDALPALTDEQSSLDAHPTGTTWFWNHANAMDDPNVAARGGYYQVVIETIEADDPDTDDVIETIDVRAWVYVEGDLDEETIVENGLPTYASANGNGLDGDGTATASGSARAEATGIALGDGADAVINEGTLTVTAESAAVFTTSADGDAFGDARGTSAGNGIARAWGVALGGGDDMLVNTGDMLVLATPSAQVLSDVSGGDICIYFFFWTWCGGGGDGIGVANAAFEATAIGVAAASGDDTIINDGLISAIARPEVRTDPRRGAFVAFVRQDADSRTVNVDVTASAVGVDTGLGNDVLINNGEIRAEAHALPGFTTLLSAIGVATGDGDDRIEQNGTIAALTYVNGVATARIGIDMGIGNDALLLGDGSTVIGSVDLGGGDDTLTLMGVPTVVDALGSALVPQGGAGVDLLILDGPGSFTTTPASFERARKQGIGTYTLPSLSTVASLAIDQGVLALGSNYQFDPLGSFSTYFHTDGDSGRLSITGASTIDGAIAVSKRGDDFVSDGSRYTLIATSAGVAGTFDSQALPLPLPLLSFSLERTSNTIDVVADAASFASVASTPLYRAVARNLDSIADDADGDLDSMMGMLQTSSGGFDAAFATLSPDAHFAPEHAALGANMEIARLLGQHLESTRAIYRGQLPASVAYGDFSAALTQQGVVAIGFSTNPADSAVGRQLNATPTSKAAPRNANAQTWALGAIGEGDYDNVDGYAQFDTDSSVFVLGRDYRLSDEVVVGASLGRTYTDVDLNAVGAKTSSDGWYGSISGTWFDDRSYVDGGLSYASQSYETDRMVTVGTVERLARADFDGQSWMAFVGAGHRFGRDRFYAEPYATLYYFDTSLDGFVEQGADSLNQIARDRTSSTLFGEAGVRVGLHQALERGVLDWYAIAGLNHDFGIDEREITYAYAGAPGAFFTIDARDIDADSTLIGAGVNYLGRRTSLSLDYRGVYNADYQDQALGLRLSFRF